MTIALRERGVEIVLLDIEGTTTPTRFVYDVLFTYARQHLGAYVSERVAAGDLDPVATLLGNEWASDQTSGEAPPPPQWDSSSVEGRSASVVAYAEWLMQRDRKSTGLKALQGQIWERGYRDGSLRGDVFPDVPPALERWRAANLSVAIYSSGSELAQQLLFGNTTYGDLTRLMSAFFDTRVGPKIEQASYQQIAGRLRCLPQHIAFISDVPRELDAARSAGLQPVLCIRPGNIPVPEDHHFECIRSFDDVAA